MVKLKNLVVALAVDSLDVFSIIPIAGEIVDVIQPIIAYWYFKDPLHLLGIGELAIPLIDGLIPVHTAIVLARDARLI